MLRPVEVPPAPAAGTGKGLRRRSEALQANYSGSLAVVDSGVSRLMPVMMAVATTILGMLSLLQDAFLISMAVTIMFGLGFATVLTLIFVPAPCAVFFRIPFETLAA